LDVEVTQGEVMIGAVSPEEPLTLEAQREDVLQKGYEVVLRFANRLLLSGRKRSRRGFIVANSAGFQSARG